MKSLITEHSTPAQKQQVVNDAIASVRIEGFEPSQTVMNILSEYVEGRISVDELQAKTLAEVKASANNS